MSCSDGVMLHVVNEAVDSLVQEYLLARLCFMSNSCREKKDDAESSVKVRQYKHY